MTESTSDAWLKFGVEGYDAGLEWSLPRCELAQLEGGLDGNFRTCTNHGVNAYLRTNGQWFLSRRNISQDNPKNNYFHYLKKHFRMKVF